MLLKFTAPDMFNSALIDVSNGRLAYDIITALQPESTSDPLKECASKEIRCTTINDASGSRIASVVWNGRQPDITILGEKIGGMTDLFASTTVQFIPKILAIPTRFDTEYVWAATSDSLTLFDYDSETIKGAFHHNVIRLPKSLGPRSKTSNVSHLREPSPSAYNLSSPISSSSTASVHCPHPSASAPSPPCHFPRHVYTPHDPIFIPTHLPGIGNDYLEFLPHPLAHDVEIIVTFLMMEILRRGRFLLTPYTFGKTKMWQLKEARDLVLRRLRRNTV